MPLPLEGVRVLDLTQVYAGPTCTRILADLGADVVKVEGLTRIDGVRMNLMTDNDPGSEPWNRGYYFSARNAGKRGLTLELRSEAGRALLRRLIPHFDVLAESFTPRVMTQFGFDYAAVKALRENIIMISLSGYGHSGPHSAWSAYGMGLEAAAGIAQTTGYRGGPPIRTGISFTDPLSGVVAAGALLTALHYRRRTGKGQYIDLSEQEAAIGLASHSLLDYQMNGRLPERMGNRTPSWGRTPQGCYRCRGEDDWLVISIANDAEWSAFCLAVGQSEWEADERFATVLARRQNHDALDSLIEGWTQAQDHYEAMRLLQKAGVTAAAVLNGKEMLFDPHLKARGQFDYLDHPAQGRRPIPRNLVAKFSRFDTTPRRAAPTLGQHNSEVLKEAGLSEEEIGTLEQAGVIGTRPQITTPRTTPGPGGSAGAFRPITPQDLIEIGALRAIEPDYKQQLGI